MPTISRQSCTDPVLCCDGQCGKPHAHCSHLCTQKCHPGNCPSCTVSVRRRCVCGVEEREQCKCASSSPLAALEQFCKIHNSDPFVGKTSLFTTFQPILQSSQSSKDQNTPKTATINLLQPLLLNQLLSQLIRCKRPCGMQLSCGKHKCAKLCCPGHFMNGAVVSMKQNQASHLENVEIRKNTENAASAALLLLQQLVLTNPTSQQSSQSSSSFSSSSSSSSQSSSLSSSQQQNQQLLPADIDALKLIIRQNLTSIHSIQSLLTSLHRCSQICGKLLDCRRHTCQQLCHSGRCDTCHQTQFTSYICPCGRTTMDPPIPCGTPIPLCPFPCSRQRQCGHNDQRNQNHPCHDDDTVCAPCTVYVPKPCIGGHNIMIAVPCHQTAASCGQPCEKLLSCGVHRCKRLCHIGECESNQHQQLLNSSQFGSRQQQGKNTMISILEAFDVDTYSLQQQQSSSQSQSQHSRSKGKISPTPQFISCGGMCQFNRSLCGHPCCETCHPLSYAPTHQQQQQTLSSQSSQQILIPPLHYSPCPLHVPCQHPVLLHCKCGLRSEVQSCNTSLAFPNAFERRIECDDLNPLHRHNQINILFLTKKDKS
ncbi:MAG: putative NF-X1 type zinc finger family protein [Streblomastix strix]|uniref:Putative NF-X1 type zinc finger family protein n=1 Tax=Streblomastix strix TaxID=222440 RepID=A0A5J4WBZ1_9EUKA|nr:MAG: putative NF-X1 type zinc finger family protein [Streblomastix strix]